MRHPDDVLDEVSRMRLREVVIIGVDEEKRLVFRTSVSNDDARDLAEIVVMGFADRQEHEDRIRRMDA
jgi:hypothetical protein